MSKSPRCAVPLCPRVAKGKRIVFGGKVLNCCHRHYGWLKECLSIDGKGAVVEDYV